MTPADDEKVKAAVALYMAAINERKLKTLIYNANEVETYQNILHLCQAAAERDRLRAALGVARKALQSIDSAYLDTLYTGERTFRSYIKEALAEIEGIVGVKK